jgi:hypothetical protein
MIGGSKASRSRILASLASHRIGPKVWPESLEGTMTDNGHPLPQSTIRGAIRVSMKNSTEVVVAGREFSVFVTVQNPFEVPLKIHKVRSHIPTGFTDVEQERRAKKAAYIESDLTKLKSIGADLGLDFAGFAPEKRHSFFSSLSKIKISSPLVSFEYANSNPGTATARDLSDETQTMPAGMKQPFIAALETTKQLKSSHLTDEERESLKIKLVEEIEEYEKALENSKKDDEATRVLQPGNTTTKVFTLRPNGRLTFNPSSYILKIEIEYYLGGEINIDSFEHSVLVKTPMLSMMLGSSIGATAGWFVTNRGNLSFSASNMIEVCVSIIIGCILIVLFSRKKDIQPFLAVEDFWGGVAIGFVSAYVGTEILDSYIPAADQMNLTAGQS